MPKIASMNFDAPPKVDKTIGAIGPALVGGKIMYRPNSSIWNGHYQHIFWIGVNGYVIVNHYEPREIVLVDPWPTYRPWLNRLTKKEHWKRLLELANFLRRGVEEGYALSGVLLTHVHYDHTRDVPFLFELLTMAPGKRKNHKRVKFNLEGPKVPVNKLPTICCDGDTGKDLKKRFKKISKLAGYDGWHDITDTGGKKLHYDDVYNGHSQNPLMAGVAAPSFPVGGFTVQPYIWDHLNVGPADKWGIGLISGSYQRMSAFLVYKSEVKKARRTFIVGSAGEMSRAHTITVADSDIKTDLLIQSICSNRDRTNELVKYQLRCVKNPRFIACSHWEKFVGGPADGSRRKKDFRKRVKTYVKALEGSGVDSRVFVFARAGFEMDMPDKPSEFLHI